MKTMAEENFNQMPEQKPETNENAAYIYRWSYGEQSMYDRRLAKKKKGHGGWTFFVVTFLVFLLAFGSLFTVLWLNDSLPFKKDNAIHLTVKQIAEKVNPATVAVYCPNTAYYGSGFLISADGYAVTNYHVISGATSIFVTLYDQTQYSATLVGGSAQDDIAVLKIEGKNLPYLELGDSASLQVGETVVAVGHPGGSVCNWSTTSGIVSYVDRVLTSQTTTYIMETHMIQTDAPVNHGNSGGPLCNDKGEVIGIVAQKLADNEGVGLAIPINGAAEIINEIIRVGNADAIRSTVTRIRPLIGITGSTIQKGKEIEYTSGEKYVAGHSGVFVSEVSASGASAGLLQVGDIIYAVDDHTISSMEEFIEMLYGYQIGDSIKLTFERDGANHWVNIVVGKQKS